MVIDTGERPAGTGGRRGRRATASRVSALGPHMIRAVTHLDVTEDDCRQAGQLIGSLLTS